MAKKNILPALLTVGATLMSLAGAAQAQNNQFTRGTDLQDGEVDSVLCDVRDLRRNNGTGFYNGNFFSWFEVRAGGTSTNARACRTSLGFNDENFRSYRVEWDLDRTFSADAVGGMGFGSGSPQRRLTYRVDNFNSNVSNDQRALVAVYGWSCEASTNTNQEYYVVDTWTGSGQFVPFDGSQANNEAVQVGRTIRSNGGTYRFYRVERSGANFCVADQNAEFVQLWSVRQGRRTTGRNQNIDFVNHFNRFNDRDLGLVGRGLSNGYQIMAVEAFGDGPDRAHHRGSAELTLTER